MRDIQPKFVCDHMNEPFNRLMKARRMAGYRSARAAASALRARPATYAAHENGTRSFSVDDAIRYAELYNVSPGWMLTGEHFNDERYAKVVDTALTEPLAVEKFQSSGEPMTHSAIYSFGKQALELLGRIEPTAEPEATGDSTSVGEVIIHRLLDGNFDPKAEQWEIVAQWQFPLDYYKDVLRVDPVDVAILAMPHNNMSPTYEVGDRLIIDFKQKAVTVDGVYIYMDESESRELHVQRITRDGKKIVVSNDNPIEDPKHPARAVAKSDIEIVGKVCGTIAAR